MSTRINDILEFREVLKDRYRKARNLIKSKEATKSESSVIIAPRLNSLMPEMMKLLEKKDNKEQPENPTKSRYSGESLKAQRARKMKESLDYSWLSSESASEVPKASKPSIPNKSVPSIPIPNATRNNGTIKKSSNPIPSGVWINNGVTKTSQEKVSGACKIKASLAKPKPVSKDSNLVPKSQTLSVKESLKPKQLEQSKQTVKPSKEGSTFVKGKVIRKRRVIEDSDDDDVTDDEAAGGFSSVIQKLMRRRGQRIYKDYDAGGDDPAMVSGFSDILREERRSTMIAIKEDAIEAARLEKEAKQQKLRKEKKQKLMK